MPIAPTTTAAPPPTEVIAAAKTTTSTSAPASVDIFDWYVTEVDSTLTALSSAKTDTEIVALAAAGVDRFDANQDPLFLAQEASHSSVRDLWHEHASHYLWMLLKLADGRQPSSIELADQTTSYAELLRAVLG